MNIITVYDNEGAFADRYTIVTDEKSQGEYNTCLCVSSNPTAPNGYSQWCCCVIGDNLGKQIKFSELPKNVQKHVQARIKEE